LAANAPLASVVIPAFNASAFVTKAIESVLLQTYPHVEVIVVDDGSSDGTMQVLLPYENQIQIYRQRNKGPAAARNQALAAVRGQYIMFLDADDSILPQKLSKQVQLLERNPAIGWTYCDIEYVNGEGQRLYLASERFSYANRTSLDGILFDQILRGNFIPVHAPLIRRDSLFAVAPFDEDKRLIGVEDWDLFLRLSSRYVALYSPEVLAKCVVHPGSLSADPKAREYRRFYLLDKTIRNHNRDIRALGITGLKVIADTHNWFAYKLLEAGRWKEAVHRLFRSLAAYPLQRRAPWALLLALIQGARSLLTKGRPLQS
jgi:glycosyltransferase involved in cell wall biosynthesis